MLWFLTPVNVCNLKVNVARDLLHSMWLSVCPWEASKRILSQGKGEGAAGWRRESYIAFQRPCISVCFHMIVINGFLFDVAFIRSPLSRFPSSPGCFVPIHSLSMLLWLIKSCLTHYATIEVFQMYKILVKGAITTCVCIFQLQLSMNWLIT